MWRIYGCMDASGTNLNHRRNLSAALVYSVRPHPRPRHWQARLDGSIHTVPKKGVFCMKQYCGIHRNAVLCQDLFLYRISITLLRDKSSSNATSRLQCQLNAIAIRNFTSNSNIIPHSRDSGITAASIPYYYRIQNTLFFATVVSHSKCSGLETPTRTATF